MPVVIFSKKTMLCKKWCLLMAILCVMQNCAGYNILILFPHFAKSHFNIFKLMFQELAIRGHNVTILSNFAVENNLTNYNQIVLPLSSENIISPGAGNLASKRSDAKITKFMEALYLHEMSREACEKSLFMQPTHDLLNSGAHFDLLMIHSFATDCFLGFVERFQAPFVFLSAGGMLPWYAQRFALPDNPSYIPNVISGLSNNMDFYERIENTIIYLWTNFLYHYVYTPIDYRLAKKAFGDDLERFDVLSQRASLMLTYSHHSIYGARPMVPSIIDVNGIHIGKQQKLPKNLQNWIDESKHGVVYFSMGSMIKGHTFPSDALQVILKTFARLKERIIWKWENETMPNKPDNVLIQKWAPQFDILCSPKTKLFISHAGLLSTTEAIHCGVPMIVIPQYGDQHTNAKYLETSGAGIILNINDINEKSFERVLRIALTQTFREKAKQLSKRYHDRPLSPMETAIYWIEYVVRHNGAHHLKTAAIGMPFYQYLLLDVIAFIITFLMCSIYLLIYSIRLMTRRL